MDYRIEIIDKTAALDPLVLQYAERDSIGLEWLGGDEKTQAIVGSQLSFTLEVNDARDAAYEQYFTSDEKRFASTLYINDTDEVVWNGYLLPESYSEPWRGGIFYVEFDATDGLGLLKGKQLPEEYYRDEKNIIEIICAVLSLTEIDIQLYFSPAIVNANEDKWHKIFFDTSKWFKEDENPSAYDILEELLQSMQCQIYQADNRWYIEGYNKKQLINLTYDVYDLDADFKFQRNVERNVKTLTYLPTPSIISVPSVSKVVATYEQEEFNTGTTLNTDKTPGFLINANNNQPFWYNDKFTLSHDNVAQSQDRIKPYIKPANNIFVLLNENEDAEIDDNRFTKLEQPYFVKKGWKINFKMSVSIYDFARYFSNEITEAIVEGYINRQVFEIWLNDNVISTNRNAGRADEEYLEYSNAGTASVDYSIDIAEDGLLDLRLYEPFGVVDTVKYPGTIFQSLVFEIENEGSDSVVTLDNLSDSSVVNEVDLKIGDDVTLFSKAFYLEQQKQREFNFQISFRRYFIISDFITIDGTLYASVNIECAEMVSRFKSELFITNSDTLPSGEIVNNPEIIFNYEDGDVHLISVPQESDYTHISVLYNPYATPTADRADWQEWIDDVEKITTKRYTNQVAELWKNLYKINHYSIEAEVDKPVKYNDVIRFEYNNEVRYFAPVNCSWFPDGNTSSVNMAEMLYDGRSAVNLNIFVDAGPDRIIDGNNQAVLISQVVIPIGTIDTVQWTVVSSDGNITIESPNSIFTTLSNLDGDNYVIELTVTSTNGSTASDTVNVNRLQEKTISLTNTFSSDVEIPDGIIPGLTRKRTVIKTYTVNFSPVLSSGEIVNLFFDLRLTGFDSQVGEGNTLGGNDVVQITARVKIGRSTLLVYQFLKNSKDVVNEVLDFKDLNVVLQTVEGADTYFEIFVEYDWLTLTVGELEVGAEVILKSAEVVSGDFVLNGLPITRSENLIFNI